MLFETLLYTIGDITASPWYNRAPGLASPKGVRQLDLLIARMRAHRRVDSTYEGA